MATHYHEILLVLSTATLLVSCGSPVTTTAVEQSSDDFQYETEQFADIRILRYQIPGFDSLSLQEKKLIYFLSEAGLSARDIIWDQNYRHNLLIRHTLENIVRTYQGPRESPEWGEFMIYLKRVWFSNGIHHHYSTVKLVPEFTADYFAELVRNSDSEGFPLTDGETVDDLVDQLKPVLFDPAIDAKKVNLDEQADKVLDSATNFYSPNLTEKEVEQFYADLIPKNDPKPVSHGLNSQLVKENGRIFERTWKVGGMYSPSLERVVYWLEQASTVAETPRQKNVIDRLIEYYRTGDLRTFDDYSIDWVEDTATNVDFINGFIEVYGDPLGYRGSYESIVYFTDPEATRRIDTLSRNAQWFEDHSPILPSHKKKEVRGISAKVITVAAEAGDSSPSTPIGINLPNANWIRQEHGSKSVNLGNIVHSYFESSKAGGVLEEFAYSEEEIQRSREYGGLADNLHTDLHEVIGHASGQIEEGVGTTKETLKSYASTLEEARADLVALYYLMDPKLVDLGVMPSLEAGRAAYGDFIRNGLLVQLSRIKPGENIEEAHMRNRQLIAEWVYQRGRERNIIERREREGKTYFVINDYEGLRELFGQLLREIQRITSQGDYEAGKKLVEDFGVQVDQPLHGEVLQRWARLNRAPYAGFINPVLEAVKDDSGAITDITVRYPTDFARQMLEYGERYSLLLINN